jgi:NAD(P)H-dependent flavin oxidoreductase YrpB (nitropropane dioxygenase family)
MQGEMYNSPPIFTGRGRSATGFSVRERMKTRITELFGSSIRSSRAACTTSASRNLAAAVSNAGGLGIITGLTQRTPDLLAAEIRRCREMTSKPFGVNLTFLPVVCSRTIPATSARSSKAA